MKSSELNIRTAIVDYGNGFNFQGRTGTTKISSRGDDLCDRGQYHQGFFDCVAETIRFLVGADGLTIDENFKRQLLQHLQQYFTGAGVKNYKPVQVESSCDLSLTNSKTNGGNGYNKRCLPQQTKITPAQKILIENNKNILNIFNNSATTATNISRDDGSGSESGTPDSVTSDTECYSPNNSSSAFDEPLDMSLKKKRPRLMAADDLKYDADEDQVLKKYTEECLGNKKKTCTSTVQSKCTGSSSTTSSINNYNLPVHHSQHQHQHQQQVQPPSRLRDILESKNSHKTNGGNAPVTILHNCRYSPSSPDKINNANSATVIMSPPVVHFQGNTTSSLPNQTDFVVPSSSSTTSSISSVSSSSSSSSSLSSSSANPMGPTTTAPNTQSRDLKVAAHLQNWLNKKRVATATTAVSALANGLRTGGGGASPEFCTQFDRHPSMLTTNLHNKQAKISVPIFALHPTGLFYFSASS